MSVSAQTRVAFVGANFHEAELPPSVVGRATRDDYRWLTNFEDSTEGFELPHRVTLGFRQIFWRVFSEFVQVAQPNIELDWLSMRWLLRSIWLAESSGVDAAVSLYDERNVIVFFELVPLGACDSTYIRRTTSSLGLDEQTSLNALLEAASQSIELRPFLSSLRHNRALPGRFLNSPSHDFGGAPDFACVLAFYSYCQLFLWQIGRYQSAIKIAAQADQSLDHLTEVLDVRASIINVDRYFLTPNVTNDPDLKTAVRAIRRSFGLRKRLEQFLSLNESIEKYVATASQIATEHRSVRLNYLVFLFTTVSIPLALVQALLSYGPTAQIVRGGFIKSIVSVSFGQFLLGTAILYLTLITLVHVLAGFSLATLQRIERIWSWVLRRKQVKPGNQKKRSFAGSPPRQHSANSAARKSPPAT